MVHGIYYGVQYEIYLNKELDLFDDILPICSDVRKMISLEKINKNSNYYKLVIIPYQDLDNRFVKREHSSKYGDSLASYHQINRRTNPSNFNYYDVKIYTDYIKHSEVPEPYTEEKLENILEVENRLEELLSKQDEDDYWDNYSSDEITKFNTEIRILTEELKVQRIVRNKEYFDKIIEIEHELTHIELTDGEKDIINRVIAHPKLEGAIKYHGFNLIDGFY